MDWLVGSHLVGWKDETLDGDIGDCFCEDVLYSLGEIAKALVCTLEAVDKDDEEHDCHIITKKS